MNNGNVKSTEGYPYPDIHGPISHNDDFEAYDSARASWRSGLSDFLVRSLASDYRMGKHTEDNYDAYLEYQLRFEQADQTARTKKPAPLKKKRKRARV